MTRFFKRETIKFYLPIDYKSVVNNTTLGRSIVPLYINPESISVSDGKLINETPTLGGYIVQYWGEKLTEFNVQGNTGSGGIEAINILKDVYRNEQIQFQKVLLKRQQALAKDSQTALEDLMSTATTKGGLVAVADVFFDGVVSDTIDSVKETIEFLKDPTESLISTNDPEKILAPTLASFAVSVDMHFQGEIHRGFFRSFSTTESTSNYGTFNYNFAFVSLRKLGERKNFMPWHKSPEVFGVPLQSTSIYSENTARLSFPYQAPKQQDIFRTSTTIDENQTGSKNSAQRSLSRYNDIISKK